MLDIRQVDVSPERASYRCYLTDPLQVTAGKMLGNEVPVFVVTFATQEVLCFKNARTGEVIIGAEDRVELSSRHYPEHLPAIEMGPDTHDVVKGGQTSRLNARLRRGRGGRLSAGIFHPFLDDRRPSRLRQIFS